MFVMVEQPFAIFLELAIASLKPKFAMCYKVNLSLQTGVAKIQPVLCERHKNCWPACWLVPSALG